jgi:hypothetical protein
MSVGVKGEGANDDGHEEQSAVSEGCCPSRQRSGFVIFRGRVRSLMSILVKMRG